MTKVISVTVYPIISSNSATFLKGIVKDTAGEWKLITTSELDDAIHYGDEAELIVNALQYKVIYVEDDDGPRRPALHVIDHIN